MNRTKNQGYQNTHAKIKNCILKFIEQKELQQISVSEICQAVGINRSTFYAHFEDIYDAVSQIQEDMETELLQMYKKADFSKEYIVKEYLIILFEHTVRHRRFYLAMLYDLNNPILQKRMELLKHQIIVPLFRQLSVPPSAGDYYFNFALSGFIAVIRQWLNANCPESPEQLAKILIEILPRRPEETPDQNFYFQEISTSNS